MKTQTLSVLFCGVICAFFTTPVASACACGDNTVAAALRHADVVFSGRVEWVRKSADGGVEARFRVERLWKGRLNRRVSIFTGPTEVLYTTVDDCGYPFRNGGDYLVFATRTKKRLNNDVCSYSGNINAESKPAAAQLGRPRVVFKRGLSAR